MKNPKDREKLMKCIYCGHWFAYGENQIYKQFSDISGVCNGKDCIILFFHRTQIDESQKIS